MKPFYTSLFNKCCSLNPQKEAKNATLPLKKDDISDRSMVSTIQNRRQTNASTRQVQTDKRWRDRCRQINAGVNRWTWLKYESDKAMHRVHTFFYCLTAHNWQKWKTVLLTCPCHDMYRDEAVDLKKMQIYLKNYDFCEYLEFGAISWKFDFCQ